MVMGETLWLSLCSMHSGDPREDCPACKAGFWTTREKMAEDRELFENDYAEWFRRVNDGKEPHDSAWATWEKLTGRIRPSGPNNGV